MLSESTLATFYLKMTTFWDFCGFQVSEAFIKCSELETNDRIELHA